MEEILTVSTKRLRNFDIGKPIRVALHHLRCDFDERSGFLVDLFDPPIPSGRSRPAGA
jgi:hypothetical protein